MRCVDPWFCTGGHFAVTYAPLADKSRRLNHTGKLMLFFVLCMGAALAVFGWEDAVLAVRQLRGLDFAILFGLASLHYVIRAGRWHMLVRAHGVASSLAQNTLHFFGGFALTATPGRLGELVRLRWLQRQVGGRLAQLLPIAIGDRAIELASLLLVIFGALAFSNLGSQAVWLLLAITLVFVALFCQPVLLEVLVVWVWRLTGRRKTRAFVRTRRIIRDLTVIMHLVTLIPLLLIGAVGWMLEGTAFWLLLDWLDIPLTLAAATAIFLVAILAGALSGLPGGFGGMESTAVALLLLQSIPAESAVIAVVIIRVTTLWFAVLIGMAVFPFAEASKDAVQHSAADQRDVDAIK
jgi:uncharacterized protein (TIRG00374 family)